MKLIFSLLCGLLFGIGLTVSQMVNPQKVINFLDIAGNWDPSLMFVMGGGLLVFALGFFFVINKRIAKKQKPVFAEQFFIPERKLIDKNLLVGAVFFGAGWGLTGICPGPVMANVLSFEPKIFAFIGMMLMGMFVARATLKVSDAKTSAVDNDSLSSVMTAADSK